MSKDILLQKNILRTSIVNAEVQSVLDYIQCQAKSAKSIYVCVANVHMVVEANLDGEFNAILHGADIVIPDGKPLAIAMNLLYGTRQKRIAGPDLMLDILKQSEQDGLSVYFLGSTGNVLDSMRQKLAADYPRLKIAGMYSPPFKALTGEEEQDIIQSVVDSGASIVFVSLGCPKQERFMAKCKGVVPAVMLGVGAAFPFYTGDLKRAPKWMQDYCLEWLFRLIVEPRRLFKRYVVTNSLFLLLFSWQWLKQRLLGGTAA